MTATTRIVTLIPSATEIVAALGFADSIVGRSHECDYPEGIGRMPALTEAKIDVDGSSADIQSQMKRLIELGLAVYRVDSERMRSLRPDVVVTQDQCQVCAASLADVEAALRAWTEASPRLVSLNPMSLDDVWADMRRVAVALGVADRGERLVAGLRGRMSDIAARAARMPARPSVALIEWIEPLMAGGNWMPTLVEMAGGANLFGTAGKHSPWLEWEAVRAADPDVILVAPCGLGLDRIRADWPALEALPGWRETRAARTGRLYAADGNQYFNRPGPRLAETLEILAEILHPGIFDFGHSGRGWIRHSR